MKFHQALSDYFLGPSLRNLPSEEKIIYLTFDDGPDPICTPPILKLLNEVKAKATFFMIADKAQKHRSLFREVMSEGWDPLESTCRHASLSIL